MNISKCFELEQKAATIYKAIEEQKNQIHNIENEIKSILPKGYWYTYDIDTSWNRPKKYSIKKVVFSKTSIQITVKEVFKKKPWPSFTGETVYGLNSFLKLNIHKTEQEAIDAYTHRICPKCGGFMMHSSGKWCNACMIERNRIIEEFNKSHMFYDPVGKRVYGIQYEDEFTRWRGYDGKHFRMRRLDTGEIIDTRNLWSHGHIETNNNLPKIQFLPVDV